MDKRGDVDAFLVALEQVKSQVRIEEIKQAFKELIVSVRTIPCTSIGFRVTVPAPHLQRR